jgi:hypothetical protein
MGGGYWEELWIKGNRLLVSKAVDIIMVKFIEGGIFFGGYFSFIKNRQIELGPFFLHLFFTFEGHPAFLGWRGFLFAHSRFSKDLGLIILTRKLLDGNKIFLDLRTSGGVITLTSSRRNWVFWPGYL